VLVYGGTPLTLERVIVAGNAGGHGGGFNIALGGQLTLRDSFVLSNESTVGAGAALKGADATLVSENTDWGSGDTDNPGADIAFLDTDGNVVASYEFDGVASFTCDGATATCE
jgi:hypothetical protein